MALDLIIGVGCWICGDIPRMAFQRNSQGRWLGFVKHIQHHASGSGEKYMDVSKNRGTSKWMVKIMENPSKMDDLGGNTPIFGNTHMLFIVFAQRSFSLEDCFGIKWHEYNFNHSQAVFVDVWIEFLFNCMLFPMSVLVTWCLIMTFVQSSNAGSLCSTGCCRYVTRKSFKSHRAGGLPTGVPEKCHGGNPEQKMLTEKISKLSWFIGLPPSSSDHQQLSLPFFVKTFTCDCYWRTSQ